MLFNTALPAGKALENLVAILHGASEGLGHAESQCPASPEITGEVLLILLVEKILDAQAQLHSGHQPPIGAPWTGQGAV